MSHRPSLDYVSRIPKTVPPDRILVHNRVQPTRRLGSRGFRAWLSAPDPERYEVCDCGWASEVGPHWRVKRWIIDANAHQRAM